MTGRYGPYVTDGEVNATIPRGVQPETLSLEEALRLISERAARMAADGGKRRGRKALKKAAAKKATAKKATKKAAAKKTASKVGAEA
jgi:DNA topoisomerase-1